MELTAAQMEAVKQGEPVRLMSAEIRAEVVVLRADLYERMLYDDGDLTDAELQALAERTFHDADTAWPIP
jgi:hypothetical protein